MSDEQKDVIPPEVQKLADEIDSYLRKIFPKEGTLLATARIVRGDGKLDLVASPFDGGATKDMFSALIRKLCKENRATMVGFYSETYYFSAQEDYDDYAAHPEKYKGNFGSHPKAKEAIMITIETKDADYLARIPILKDRVLDKSDPLIKAVEFSGRMKFL